MMSRSGPAPWPRDVNFSASARRTNIQDGSVVHVSHDGPHAKLGGFASVIGATSPRPQGDHPACRIEMRLDRHGSIVLDGAVVEKHGFVAPAR